LIDLFIYLFTYLYIIYLFIYICGQVSWTALYDCIMCVCRQWRESYVGLIKRWSNISGALQ